MSSVSNVSPVGKITPGVPVDNCNCMACKLNRLERQAQAQARACRHSNGQPITLVEFVDDEARAYRDQGTPEAAFLAEQLERVAQLIRWTRATTPAEFADRMEVWDDEIRMQNFDRGYTEGIAAARGCPLAS